MTTSWNRGRTRLTESQYIELACRILRNRHVADVQSRTVDLLGEKKADRIGPIDMTRNVLRSWTSRVCRAYDTPPLVSGLTDDLVAAIGDYTASTTARDYAQLGGRPMPSVLADASRQAHIFQEAAGFCGVLLSWSDRSGRLVPQVIAPDEMAPPRYVPGESEPVVVEYRSVRVVGGSARSVTEIFSVEDSSAPFYRVMSDGADVTALVHGDVYEGDSYTALWSYSDGRPFLPIVVRGHIDRIYDRLQQVEGSLIVPARWTAWGSGCDLSSHPRSNVRGMRLVGGDSSTATGQTGADDGPDVVHRWEDTDPEKPGDHWQDKPAFDPLTTGRAVAFYETMILSALDLPMMENTGGEPTQRELEARATLVRAALPECRRFDGELLTRASAMMARRTPGGDWPTGPFGILYHDEITAARAAITAPAATAEVQNV